MKWTEKEEARLRSMYHKGVSVVEIASNLKRKKASIASKIQGLGLKRKEPKIDLPPEEDPRIKKLEEQVRGLLQRKRIVIHNFFGKEMRIGVVSDSHIGSLYERIDILEAAYDVFEKHGITAVYHCGDMCEGSSRMHAGQEFEVYAHGADAQVQEAIKKYPFRKNIKTYFIAGSHDLSFWKSDGIDIGEQIAEKRRDMVYLGKELADIMIGEKKNTIRMRMFHPRFGSAYALSYLSQKYIDSLAGGQKPQILLIGH